MNTKRISESEIATLKISSLPTRPTLPSQYGGRGYTALEMKSAFDALPLFLVERFNSLFDDVSADADESIATEVNTGLEALPKLSDIFKGIADGTLADSLIISEGESLSYVILKICEDIALIKERLGISEVAE